MDTDSDVLRNSDAIRRRLVRVLKFARRGLTGGRAAWGELAKEAYELSDLLDRLGVQFELRNRNNDEG